MTYTYINLAQTFCDAFETIDREDDGKRICEQFQDFKQDLDKVVINAKEECPESHDSTLILTLTDGSVLRLANPNQSDFSAYVEVLNESN